MRLTVRKVKVWCRGRIRQWLMRWRPMLDPTKRDVWSIAIYEGESPFDLRPAGSLVNPILTAKDVTDLNAGFVADPYLVKTECGWNMFFEVMDLDSNLGRISTAGSVDGREWKYGKVVLAEPFHLSYPCVFAHGGHHYMIPETHQARAVKLYQATNYPYEWQFVKNLIEGELLVDASPFRFQDCWWLFASGGDASRWYSQDLRLFFADDLMGPWHEHPKSPLIRGNPRISRPAGRVLLIDGVIIRFAQDCRSTYGKCVRAFRVTRLSKTEYEERPVGRKPILSASGSGWNSVGMHHIDAHPGENGRWWASVDGWTWGNL